MCELLAIILGLEASMPSTGADKVLVVEDDPGIRELVTMALEDEGFQVEEARDGAAAIQAINEPRPLAERLCLILLDMMLPKADGLEVLSHLSAQGCYIPVVAMSANRQKLAAAEQAGAQETLPKPFELDDLLGVVGRCCPH
jgi:CheY-like chemotaxis protein